MRIAHFDSVIGRNESTIQHVLMKEFQKRGEEWVAVLAKWERSLERGARLSTSKMFEERMEDIGNIQMIRRVGDGRIKEKIDLCGELWEKELDVMNMEGGRFQRDLRQAHEFSVDG
jgi:hypothetical protein